MKSDSQYNCTIGYILCVSISRQGGQRSVSERGRSRRMTVAYEPLVASVEERDAEARETSADDPVARCATASHPEPAGVVVSG